MYIQGYGKSLYFVESQQEHILISTFWRLSEIINLESGDTIKLIQYNYELYYRMDWCNHGITCCFNRIRWKW